MAFNDIGNWWNSLFQPQTTQANPFVGGKLTGSAGSVVPRTPAVAPAPSTNWPYSGYNPTYPPTGTSGYRATSPYNSVTATAFPPTTQPPSDEDMTWPEGSDYWWRIQQVEMDKKAAADKAAADAAARDLAERKFLEDVRMNGLEYALSQQSLSQRTASDTATQQYQQQQLAAEQAWRTQQIEAEKQQRLATLSAQPKSWLEYAALANQPPVVQPWMLPLMPQDYMNQAVGSPIAGWTPENMKGMPDLINPSAQYMARLSPDQRAQYYGYQQADTGQTPESMEWRLWSQAPAGSVKNLSYTR